MKSIVILVLLAMLTGAVGQQPGSATVITAGAGPAYFVRYSPDGRELVRVCAFGFPMLFDTGNYNKARTFPVGLRMVAYSPDGTRIATAEGRDGARVWDSALPGRPIPNGLEDAKWPNGKPPAGFVLDVRELDTPLKVLQTPSRDDGVRVFWTEFSPDGQRLITTHANGHVKIWNTSSWNLEADLALTHREVRAAAFAPDGNSLVIGDIEGTLHQWSFASKSEVKTTRTIGPIAGVVFSPDGKTLVTTHQSPSGSGVMIWNTDTWVAVTRDGFAAAAFSKDGKILALGGKSIEMIDPGSQQQLRNIDFLPTQKQPHEDTKSRRFVVALAFSPDGATLAAGFNNGDVVLANRKE